MSELFHRFDARALFPDGVSRAVTADAVLRFLGGEQRAMPGILREAIQRHIDRIDERGRDAAAVIGLFPAAPVPERAGALRVGGVEFSCGMRITSRLEDAEDVAVLLATSGAAFAEDLDRAARSGDVFEHYIADAVGSVFAEACAEAAHERIRQDAAARGRACSNRYSPGYCGWSVSDQHLLFSLLGDEHCGVSLTESGMMHPVKSVTACVGVGRNMEWHAYDCADCTSFDCVYRPDAPASAWHPARTAR